MHLLASWLSLTLAATAPDPAAIGTAHPSVLMASSPDARWVVLCQARKDTDNDGSIELNAGLHGDFWGDDLEPYFIQGAGEGEQLDDFVDSDPTGRYVVLIKNNALHLIDTQTNKDLDLTATGASIQDDPDPQRGHRAAAFDSTGQRLTYFRQTEKGEVIVVRDLESGKETELTAGDALLYRAEPWPGGDWLTVVVVREDTNNNGKLEWPSARTSLAPRRCRGSPMSSSRMGGFGDRPSVELWSLDGQRITGPGWIAPFGQKHLRREQDGRIVTVVREGKTEQFVPASCIGVLQHLDPTRGLVVVACSAQEKKGRTPIELFGPELHVKLGEGQDVARKDNWTDETGRFAPLRPSPVTLLDQDQRKLITMGAKSYFLTLKDTSLLYVTDVVRWRNLLTGEEKPFKDLFVSYGVRTRGKMALVPHKEGDGAAIVDVASGTRLGDVENAWGITLAADGRYLQPSARIGGIDQGPFRWVVPQPAPAKEAPAVKQKGKTKK